MFQCRLFAWKPGISFGSASQLQNAWAAAALVSLGNRKSPVHLQPSATLRAPKCRFLATEFWYFCIFDNFIKFSGVFQKWLFTTVNWLYFYVLGFASKPEAFVFCAFTANGKQSCGVSFCVAVFTLGGSLGINFVLIVNKALKKPELRKKVCVSPGGRFLQADRSALVFSVLQWQDS